MKISIITVTYNSSETIADCIKSVYNQTYSDIEHIIIDGNSKDNTLKIINSIPNRISKIISEPDLGIYDAMNKGLKLATGEVVGILNSDDFFYDYSIIAKIVNTFSLKNCDCLFGDIVYVNRKDTAKIIRYWKSSVMPKHGFSYGWHPAHPSFYVKKEIYQEYGYFKIKYQFSADFELMLRLLHKNLISYSYLAIPMVRMRLGGKTSKNLNNVYLGNKECVHAFKDNNIKISILYLFFRFLMKIKQFRNHPKDL